MDGCFVVFITVLEIGFCDWVLIPVVSSKPNDFSSGSESKHIFIQNSSVTARRDSCPDFHNLTAMGFASSSQYESIPMKHFMNVSLEDVEAFFVEKKKIPGTVPEKTNFLAAIGENLMTEAEKRIKNLFPAGTREARFASLHFPTMESSLMTISMLLFGVYLTKLIVKLLQSHYTKYNMPIRTMTGTRTPIFMPQNKLKRSIETDLQLIRIMNSIGDYNSQFEGNLKKTDHLD